MALLWFFSRVIFRCRILFLFFLEQVFFKKYGRFQSGVNFESFFYVLQRVILLFYFKINTGDVEM